MTSARLSVLVKRSPDVVKPHTVLKCSWNDSFVEKIHISRNDKFISPNHTVPIDAPISICEQFGCAYICIYVAQSCSGVESRCNAFEMLMTRSHEHVLPSAIEPPVGMGLRQDQILYSDLLGKFHVL